MKGTIYAVALAALTLFATLPDVHAQAGRRYYCGQGENTATCGPSGAPGIGNSCSASGCHARNPLNDAQGRVMKAAGSVSAILGSPDQGMQAILSLYEPAELDSIAAWLLTLATGGGTRPSCTVSASNTSPNVGTSITLSASCTNSPTSYAWTNCSSTTSTCTASQATTGARTYSVTASNASGASTPASVNVNWTTPGAPPPPPPPPPENPPEAPPPTTAVVEYLHAGFGHYFITGFAGEITALDAGQVAGWSRTGRSFSAYTQSNGSQRVVCRFFTVAFPPRSSHFYTPSTEECNGLRSSSGVWQYEADSFYVAPTDTVLGSCPTGTQAVFRLYNNGQSGAPNHRYTTDPAVRSDMMSKGWIPEGYGPEGVAFCAPI